jgi:SAM-dependent methyltransferase
MLSKLNLFFLKISKLISRKKLYSFIKKEISKELLVTDRKLNILNVGSGGDVQKTLQQFEGVNLLNIDIDQLRKPDIVCDITDTNLLNIINFEPDVVCIFEVLEHIKEPHNAIKNIYKILKKGGKCLCSTPFIFPIHDEPNDYFRFTIYGLKLLFKDFSTINILKKNGWLESSFVNFVRLIKEKNFILKIIAIFFIILYFLAYPLIMILQKFTKSDRLTTGYFLTAKK